jgi:hypothetical protein
MGVSFEAPLFLSKKRRRGEMSLLLRRHHKKEETVKPEPKKNVEEKPQLEANSKPRTKKKAD